MQNPGRFSGARTGFTDLLFDAFSAQKYNAQYNGAPLAPVLGPELDSSTWTPITPRRIRLGIPG